MGNTLNLTLKIWRMQDPASPGRFENYEMRDVSPDVSFLEMLDLLNRELEILELGRVVLVVDVREDVDQFTVALYEIGRASCRERV